MNLRTIIGHILRDDGVVRIPTAVDPLIWICAISTPCCLTTAWALKGDPVLVYSLVVLAAFPILATSATCLYFVIRDPDRLQAVSFKMRPRGER